MAEKIIIISNYYPPEIGAAANRIKNLAESLQMEGNEVTVICPLPNYPKGKIFKDYKWKIFKKETTNNIFIKRSWIFPSKSKNGFIRLLSMLSFAFSLWLNLFSLLRKKPNLIIIQSPPLFVAFSGLILSKFINCKNVLNVSDIWPLSAFELGVIKKGFFYSFLEKIEMYNYKMANRIICQSNEIAFHIKRIVKKDLLIYRNTPSYKEYPVKLKNNETLKIVYAGLLGYAQGLLNICKNVDFKKLNSELHLYGSGLEVDEIKAFIKNKNSNIFFHGEVSKTELNKELLKYDAGLVPLKNKIFGAVPSKIFELMKYGIPILFHGDGEGAKIVLKENLGFVSKPNDIESLKENIIKFNKLSKEEYRKLSDNNLIAHKKEYNLQNQFNYLNKNFIK